MRADVKKTKQSPFVLSSESASSYKNMPRTIVDLTASSPPSNISTGSRLLADPCLREMIDHAPIDRVRLTLRAVCSHSTTASDTARRLLVTPQVLSTKEEKVDSESSADEEEEEEDEDEDEEEEVDIGRKVATTRTVKKPRFAVCRRCLEDFDVKSRRRAHECVSHSGESMCKVMSLDCSL